MILKKASAQLGGGIIAVAIILLLGGIFIDSFEVSSKKNNNNQNNNYGDNEDYLFHLNNTDIGRQKKSTQSFPNIELGTKTTYNTIFVEPLVELRSNPFTYSDMTFTIDPPIDREVEQYLVYASPDIISGEAILEFYYNDTLISQRKVYEDSFPVPIRKLNDLNQTSEITMNLKKPAFYSIFSWNKVELKDFRIVEQSKSIDNKKREFNFQADKNFLNNSYLQLSISCEDSTNNEPIKVTLNGYIISNQNPKCESNYNTITANVPLNIIKDNKNDLVFETNGYYKLGYSINNIYYNDKDTYKFTINNFNDIVDVVIYGDFDREVIDIRLNNKLMTLRRDEIKSIIPYLEFGTNEIEIETKPIGIEELTIEKN